MKKKIIVAGLLVFAYVNLFAEELYLKSGEIISNEIISITNSGYIVKDGSTWREISKNEISFVREAKENDKKNITNIFIPELIVKVGLNFTNEVNSVSHKTGNSSYDASNSFFLGTDLYIPVSNNLSLGIGAKANLYSTLQSGYGYFYSIPFFMSVKVQHKINKTINIYSSFNLGSSFIASSDEFMADNGDDYDPINQRDYSEREYSMQPYYGLNFGIDMNGMIVELGFAYESSKISGGNRSIAPDDINIARTSLSIGYKI